MMKLTNGGMKRRWVASAVGGFLVVTVVALLFRSPAPPVPLPRAAEPLPIRLHPSQPDELAIVDLTPLFLPTRYNAQPMEVPHREPGRTLLDQDRVKLVFDEENPAVKLPAPSEIPTPAEAVLQGTPGALAFGIGRTDARVPAVPAHGAFVDVYSAETGKPMLDETIRLGVDARPPVGGRGDLGWQPLEFFAAVDATGLVGAPTLTASSGVEEVDNHFRNYLARVFRLGDRLPPGFYRIVIGP